MTRFLFLAIGMFFGAGLGFMLALNVDAPATRHDHAAPADVAAAQGAPLDHLGHHDMPVHTDAWAVKPTLDAVVTKDPVSGWNLQITTSGFVFAPARAGSAAAPGEGHAHLYLDGKKIARMYGEWFHIPSVPETGAQLRVSLNDNAHHPLYRDGKPIEVIISLAAP